jgi:hypothetical protein
LPSRTLKQSSVSTTQRRRSSRGTRLVAACLRCNRHHPSPKLFKRRHQESNLVYELRGLACEIRHTPRTSWFTHQHPAEESNLVRQFRRLPCFHHTRRATNTNVPTWTRSEDHELRRPGCVPLHTSKVAGTLRRAVAADRLTLAFRAARPQAAEGCVFGWRRSESNRQITKISGSARSVVVAALPVCVPRRCVL